MNPSETTILIQPLLFPPINWFLSIKGFESLILEKDGKFVKQTYRNRYRILTSNGIKDMIIPISGHKNGLTLIEIKVDQTSNWHLNHLKTIKSAYGKSPFFDYFYPEIEGLLKSAGTKEFLIDVNLHCLDWCFSKLKKKWNLPFMAANMGSVENISDFRTFYNSKHPNLEEVDFQYTYFQVFMDRVEFQSNLSILDYFFCCGTDEISID